MSYLLPHLHSGFAVDQAIVSAEDRVVCIRFGHDHDPECMLQVPADGRCVIPPLRRCRACRRRRARSHPSQDETLVGIADKVKNYAVIYLVDITEVPDFNTMVGREGALAICRDVQAPTQRLLNHLAQDQSHSRVSWLTCPQYELYDSCTMMFFFRNKHIMIDLGTGNNNKINWALTDKQELIDIIETVYR